MEDTNTPSLFAGAMTKMNDPADPQLPFVLLGATAAVAGLGAWITYNGLKAHLNPERTSNVRSLAQFGEPIELIAQFEAEAGSGKFHYKSDYPVIMVTDSFFFCGASEGPTLVPRDQIVWVYGKKNGEPIDDIALSIFADAGVMSKGDAARRAADAKAMQENTYLMIRVKGEPAGLQVPIAANVQLKIDEVLRYFLDHEPEVIVGYADVLDDVWAVNRDHFLSGRDAIQSLAETGMAPEKTP
ncbi:MAG: hypothetical protein RIA71_09165 [Oceanicaulis sp.]